MAANSSRAEMKAEETPIRRRRSWPKWGGLVAASVVGLMWLLGFWNEAEPPVRKVGEVALSRAYPEWGSDEFPWARFGNAYASFPEFLSPPGIRGLDGAARLTPEHIPWLLWRARQGGNPMHPVLKQLWPMLPTRIQTRLSVPISSGMTRFRILGDLHESIREGDCKYADVLAEVSRLPQERQQRLIRLLRGLGELLGEELAEADPEVPDLLLRLVRNADPQIRVLAGVQLIGHFPAKAAMADDLQPTLLRLAQANAGEPDDWMQFARFATQASSGTFDFDSILHELSHHPDPEVPLFARAAWCLRSRSPELASLVRSEVDLGDWERRDNLANFLLGADASLRSGIRPEVAPELARLMMPIPRRVAPVPVRKARPESYYLRLVPPSDALRKHAPEAASLLLLDMGTNAASASKGLLEVLELEQTVGRDTVVGAATVLASLRYQVHIVADYRVLRLLPDPFLTEHVLDMIGSGGLTNAHAYGAVAPFLVSHHQGIRRAAFEAAIRIREPDSELWPLARAALDDPVRQQLALQAVARFGAAAREVLPRLREIASDPSEARGMQETRRLATEAIRALEGGTQPSP